MLHRLELATASVMTLKGRGGALSISVGASVGSYWLIPRLPGFTRDHGEITLNLATRVGPVDFRATPVHASLEFSDGLRLGVTSDFVLPLTLSPYASPAWVAINGKNVDENTPKSALLHHQTLPDSWDGWFGMEGIAGEAGRDGPRFEIMSMALNAAVAGLGVVLLPPYMGDDMVAAGKLRRLSRRQWREAKGYYLVYPEGSAQMQSLQIFRTWLLLQARH